MRTVLVVEDEARLAETLRYNLEGEGFRVRTASDGVEGLSLARTLQPDLVLLDLMLPALDGVGVLRGIREDSQVPVLLLTARSSEADRVRGLDLGADDYITKPFSVAELMARVRAHLRRKPLAPELVGPRTIEFGEPDDPFTLDLNRRQLRRATSRSPCGPRNTSCSPTSHSATAAPSPATNCSTTCGTSPSPAAPAPSTSTSAGCA